MADSVKQELFATFDLSGGLNTKFDKTSLAENEVADIENFHLQARGGVEKRLGYTPWITGDSAVAAAITGVYQFINQAGTKFNIRISGTAAHYENAGAWTAITGAHTITTGQNNRWVFQTFRGNVIATNGTDIPFKWPGTGNIAAIARAIGGGADTIDKAATLVRHRERIVLGDVTATESAVQTRYESVIWPSDAGTLDTWSAAPDGKIHIDQGDGDSITCLLDVHGYLIVFKQHSLHRVSDHGTAATQERKRIAAVGTPGPHTAIVAEKIVYFVDSEGRFWAYDPFGTDEDALVELSQNKLGQSTFDSFVLSRLRYGHALYHPHRKEIWWFLTDNSGTSTNVAYIYSISTGGFTKLRFNSKFNCCSIWLDSNNHPQIVGGIFGGHVHKLDTGHSDNGASINAFVTTRHFPLGNPAQVAGLRDIDVYVDTSQTTNFNMELRPAFSSTGTVFPIAVGGSNATTWGSGVWGIAKWGGTIEASTKIRQRLAQFVRWAQLKFSHVEDKEFTLLGFVIGFVNSGRRRV